MRFTKLLLLAGLIVLLEGLWNCCASPQTAQSTPFYVMTSPLVPVYRFQNKISKIEHLTSDTADIAAYNRLTATWQNLGVAFQVYPAVYPPVVSQTAPKAP